MLNKFSGLIDFIPSLKTGARLNVNSLASPVPSQDLVYAVHRITTGGSDALNVNGSVTPVNCNWTVPAGETWYVESISLYLQDNGTSAPTAFGSIAGGIANGLLIQIQSNGTSHNVATINNNIQLQLAFRAGPTIPPTTGFNETADAYIGELLFYNPVIVKNSTSDYVRVRVQDNLTGLDQLRVHVKAWRLTT